MKIGLDIDGVVYPWHYSVYRYFTEFYNFSGTEESFWDYFRTFSKERQDYFVSIPTLYNDTIPSACIKDAIVLLSGLGELFYVTSRNLELATITQKFFNFMDLPFKENLVFEKDKSTFSRLNRLDYFLDDLPENVTNLSKVTNAYLMCVPHNRNQRDGFNTVGSIKEFYEAINDRSK